VGYLQAQGPVTWTSYYLYVILDVFSRYVVGWSLQMRESGELAKDLIGQAVAQQQVGQPAPALPVGRLAVQAREEVDESPSGHRQEPSVGGDAHDGLGYAERDQLGVADAAPCIGTCLWQKVVGCAINHGAESVEVGVHRGLRADGVFGTVGFGLSALLSLRRLNLVESII
jgi:hypothetical protein